MQPTEWGAIFESRQEGRPAGKRNPERRELLGVLHFWRNDAGMREVIAGGWVFSVVREENAGGGVEGVAGVDGGVLGGVFSRRIGLARRGAFYSATGG